MHPFHIFIALVIAAVWGANFVTVRLGLREIPPFLFCALRFIVAFLPIIIIPKPPVSWKILKGIGIFQGTIKFSLVFIGMYLGMSAGLSSLVLQTQVFFTICISFLLFGTSISPYQLLGILLSFCGILLIGHEIEGESTFLGFFAILASALAWSIANIYYQQIKKSVDFFGIVVWSSIIPPIPLLICSLLFEGPETIIQSLSNISLLGVSCVFLTAAGGTWIGAALWGYLTSIYGASVVAPYALLIPVFGLLSGWLILGENPTPLMGTACALILIGLFINQFSGAWIGKNRLETAPEGS